ncbi:hypothetical protein SDC9_79319 [bioreactor metagenome]|uniref:Uncharacterized protein n=1 Tax=bioreactor metagenome TaxID=1076179 RepID=A0A644Z3Q9_9ZZZZ
MVKLNFKAVSVGIRAYNAGKRGVSLGAQTDVFHRITVQHNAGGNIFFIGGTVQHFLPVVLLHHNIQRVNAVGGKERFHIGHFRLRHQESEGFAKHKQNGRQQHGRNNPYTDRRRVFMP